MDWLTEIRLGFGITNPRATITMRDEDIDRMPGQLPRIAHEMNAAKTPDEVRAAARAFIDASSEYID